VLIIIPDSTRTAPIPQMFRLFYEALGKEVAALDYLIALGTHKPMHQEAIDRLVGITPTERQGKYADVKVFNHRWDLPETFVTVGHITPDEIEKLTGGLMRQAVDVRLTGWSSTTTRSSFAARPSARGRRFSGNKYFFPGIGGDTVINFSHWLGAVITSYSVIGPTHTGAPRHRPGCVHD
jgi:nickel-dependent lactate racemase